MRQFAQQRGYDIVEEFVDYGVSGTKVRRPTVLLSCKSLWSIYFLTIKPDSQQTQ
jgi:hypothetical protein